jgi:hypothetical protein
MIAQKIKHITLLHNFSGSVLLATALSSAKIDAGVLDWTTGMTSKNPS